MSQEEKLCPRCHKPVPAGARLCPNCGYTLIQQTPTTMVQEQSSQSRLGNPLGGSVRSTGMMIILLIVGIILLILVVALFFAR